MTRSGISQLSAGVGCHVEFWSELNLVAGKTGRPEHFDTRAGDGLHEPIF